MGETKGTTKPVRVVITGVTGRMGSVLVNSVREADDLRLVGGTVREGREEVGLDAGLASGAGPLQAPVRASLEEALAPGADVVIDFTNADVSLENARVCAERGVALVLGSTGFSAGARAEIAGRARQIPIVMAPNMSVGVNVLFRVASEVARILGDDYDVEIFEAHHRLKKDSPSGTALRLVEGVADALGLDPELDVIGTREGMVGERPRRKIGVQVIRGGDVVGEHTVLFLGEGERVELTHKASSRANFAAGALRAARWCVGREPGLYDMLDVLGLAANRAR